MKIELIDVSLTLQGKKEKRLYISQVLRRRIIRTSVLTDTTDAATNTRSRPLILSFIHTVKFNEKTNRLASFPGSAERF